MPRSRHPRPHQPSRRGRNERVRLGLQRGRRPAPSTSAQRGRRRLQRPGSAGHPSRAASGRPRSRPLAVAVPRLPAAADTVSAPGDRRPRRSRTRADICTASGGDGNRPRPVPGRLAALVVGSCYIMSAGRRPRSGTEMRESVMRARTPVRASLRAKCAMPTRRSRRPGAIRAVVPSRSARAELAQASAATPADPAETRGPCRIPGSAGSAQPAAGGTAGAATGRHEPSTDP